MKKILILLLIFSLAFCSCAKEKEEEQKEEVNYREKMAESVVVDSIDGEIVSVSLPDFESFFNDCINEVKEKAKNDEDFNRRLLRALYRSAKQSEALVTKEYKIDLSLFTSDEEIENYIKEYAIEKEIEAYCMKVVLLEAPDIKE